MPFKKLEPQLLENLDGHGFEEPTPFQKDAISKIKSGVNFYGIAPKGAGKSTALVIGAIQKCKAKPEGDNPRVLIFVKDKEAVIALEEAFKPLTYHTGLRVVGVNEEHNLAKQKDAVYLGSDILIATPKRLCKLYFLNGVNLSQLQMLVVEDAAFLMRNTFHTDVNRIAESMEKCQHLIFADKFDAKIDHMTNQYMERAQKVEIKE
jgi:superfamily II DNA/RNA helicase